MTTYFLWPIAYSNDHLSSQYLSCNNFGKVKMLATTLGQARVTRHPLKITSPTMALPPLRCFSRWFWNNCFLWWISCSFHNLYPRLQISTCVSRCLARCKRKKEKRRQKKAGSWISRISCGFLIWGEISFRAVGVCWSNVFLFLISTTYYRSEYTHCKRSPWGIFVS